MGAARVLRNEAMSETEFLFAFFVLQRHGFRIKPLDSKQHGIVQPILTALHARDEPNTWPDIQAQLPF